MSPSFSPCSATIASAMFITVPFLSAPPSITFTRLLSISKRSKSSSVYSCQSGFIPTYTTSMLSTARKALTVLTITGTPPISMNCFGITALFTLEPQPPATIPANIILSSPHIKKVRDSRPPRTLSLCIEFTLCRISSAEHRSLCVGR